MSADPVPDLAAITDWLARHNHPAEWADFLTGLPWCYIEPVVMIAVNTRNHPALALAGAAISSSDETFKAVARAHLEAKDPARPNRAQRRAAAKRGGRRG